MDQTYIHVLNYAVFILFSAALVFLTIFLVIKARKATADQSTQVSPDERESLLDNPSKYHIQSNMDRTATTFHLFIKDKPIRRKS